VRWRIRIKTPHTPKLKPRLPHSFVLEALATLNPEVRRLFSGWAVYVGNRLVVMLLDHARHLRDNGVWLVLSEGTDPMDPGLRQALPSLRPIQGLGGKIGHWLVLPADGADFEREALRACDLILSHDPRIGRIPHSRR
jgi:hypothetical protein